MRFFCVPFLQLFSCATLHFFVLFCAQSIRVPKRLHLRMFAVIPIIFFDFVLTHFIHYFCSVSISCSCFLFVGMILYGVQVLVLLLICFIMREIVVACHVTSKFSQLSSATLYWLVVICVIFLWSMIFLCIHGIVVLKALNRIWFYSSFASQFSRSRYDDIYCRL